MKTQNENEIDLIGGSEAEHAAAAAIFNGWARVWVDGAPKN